MLKSRKARSKPDLIVCFRTVSKKVSARIATILSTLLWLIMEQHRIQSLLDDPGSSAAEFEEKIRGFSSTQLQGIIHKAFIRSSQQRPCPLFVCEVLLKKIVEKKEEETLKAAASVKLIDLRSKLPFLNDLTETPAHVDAKHTERSRTETILNFDEVQNIPQSVWDGAINIEDKDTITVQSENSVVIHLNNLYTGLIRALGVDNKIRVIVTRTIAGNECDIVLAAKETFQPLSVTEVKKPHSPEDDEKIFLLSGDPRKKSATIGQQFDQLHNIKWMTGSKKIYGMISTGNSFMFTCTDSFSDSTTELTIAPETFTREIDQDYGNGEKYVSPTRPMLFNDDESEPESPVPDADERLYTSQVVQISEDGPRDASKQIVNMLILQIAKAMECLKNLDTPAIRLPVKGTVYSREIDLKTGKKQCYKQITLKEGWQECLNRYISPRLQYVSLIRSVGSGASGDCYFAVSTNNQQQSCVIKFFQALPQATTLQQAECEKANWDKAYGTGDFKTRVVQLGILRGCLVMPYVDIASVNRNKCLQNGAKELRDCLKRFSSRNSGCFLLHLDIKWRHLGYLQKKLTLVDLGYVKETKNKDEWLKWMEDCVKVLKNSKSLRQKKRKRPN